MHLTAIPRTVMVVATLILALGAVGCGKESSSAADSDGLTGTLGKVRLCLTGVGARVAHRATDVPFFVEDWVAGRVNKPSGGGDGIVQIAQYEPAGSVRSAPPYMVWVGQAASNADLDPQSALSRGSEAFLVYLREPTPEQMRKSGECVNSFGVSP